MDGQNPYDLLFQRFYMDDVTYEDLLRAARQHKNMWDLLELLSWIPKRNSGVFSEADGLRIWALLRRGLPWTFWHPSEYNSTIMTEAYDYWLQLQQQRAAICALLSLARPALRAGRGVVSSIPYELVLGIAKEWWNLVE